MATYDKYNLEVKSMKGMMSFKTKDYMCRHIMSYVYSCIKIGFFFTRGEPYYVVELNDTIFMAVN